MSFFRRVRYRLVISESVEPPRWDGVMLSPCHLDFYCDYGAEIPLWIGGSGMARAESVPVSADLRRDLVAFQEWFESGVGPWAETTPAGFEDAGRALLARVRVALPAPWIITSSWYDEGSTAI